MAFRIICMTSIGSGARTSALVREGSERVAIMLTTVTITVKALPTDAKIVLRSYKENEEVAEEKPRNTKGNFRK